MFVLLYSVCHSANVTSFFFSLVWTSFNCNNYFTYVLRVIILDVTKRHGQSMREKERGDTNCLSYRPSENKNNRNIWLWLVCCYLPPTCCLHLALRAGLEAGKPNNVPANNRRASNGHSRGGGHRGHSTSCSLHLNFVLRTELCFYVRGSSFITLSLLLIFFWIFFMPFKGKCGCRTRETNI